MTDSIVNHSLRRDGPLRGVYRGLTQRPDDPSQPGSLNHPVALVSRRDGQDVALHLTDPALLQRWTEEAPGRGEAVGAYYDARTGRPDVVVQRPDYLDGGVDDDGGAGRRADEGEMLKLSTARYSREHPGAGEPVGHADSRPVATTAPAAPAVGQFSNPYPAHVAPGSLDVPFRGDFIDGLADGLSTARGLDASDDPQLRKLAELERRHGDGQPGHNTRSR